MITNLFSLFDPITSDFLSLNWFRVILLFFIMPINYYFLPSVYYYSHYFLLIKVNNEFSRILKSLGGKLLFSSLLYIVFIFNFIGLFPYVFTLTGHMVITVRLVLPIWLGIILYGWLNYSFIIFSHLVPLGTPSSLISFIVLIETVSQLIRPLTLSVRLSANIIAGHLLLCLIGSVGPLSISLVLPILLLLQVSLYILELGVSLIQAYVLSVLCALYSREVDY